MNKSGWLWRHWRRRLGWPGLAGGGLILLALLIEAGGAIPARLRLEGLKEQIAEGKTRAATLAARPESQGAEGSLAAFYQAFPSRDSVPDWLGKIYAAGDQAGLSLEKGEYKPILDRNSRLLRYEINLPVHGTYGQVRQFLTAVLAAEPTLALRDIQFRRANIAEPAVDAQIGFALYLRESGT